MKNKIAYIGIFSMAFAVAIVGFLLWYNTKDDYSQQAPLSIKDMNFTLTSQSGEKVSDKDFIGNPHLMYFGFTFCPDVCPTTLSDIRVWVETLGEEAEALKVAFITVDPERDTAKSLANYTALFHPKIIGYTGSEKEISKTASDFKAVYYKIETEDGGYTMEHSASVFLYDREGNFITTIYYGEPYDIALEKIRRILRK